LIYYDSENTFTFNNENVNHRIKDEIDIELIVKKTSAE